MAVTPFVVSGGSRARDLASELRAAGHPAEFVKEGAAATAIMAKVVVLGDALAVQTVFTGEASPSTIDHIARICATPIVLHDGDPHPKAWNLPSGATTQDILHEASKGSQWVDPSIFPDKREGLSPEPLEPLPSISPEEWADSGEPDFRLEPTEPPLGQEPALDPATTRHGPTTTNAGEDDWGATPEIPPPSVPVAHRVDTEPPAAGNQPVHEHAPVSDDGESTAGDTPEPEGVVPEGDLVPEWEEDLEVPWKWEEHTPRNVEEVSNQRVEPETTMTDQEQQRYRSASPPPWHDESSADEEGPAASAPPEEHPAASPQAADPDPSHEEGLPTASQSPVETSTAAAARERAEAAAREAAEAQAAAEAAAREAAEAEERERQEAEERRAAAEARERAEAEARAKEEAEAQERAQAEARAEAEAREREQAEARAREEAERAREAQASQQREQEAPSPSPQTGEVVWETDVEPLPDRDPYENPVFGSSPWASQAADSRPRGVVIAVVAAKGGVGKSSMTLFIAQGLSDAKKEVAVVDANIGQPDIGKALGVHGHTMGLTALKGGDRFTPEELEDALHFVPQVGDVLIGPPKAIEVHPELAVGALRLAIDQLAKSYDFVVVDTPVATVYEPVLGEVVIPAADVFVVVTKPHEITLHDTHQWLYEASQPKVRGGHDLPRDRCVGVLNGAEDSSGITVEEAQEWVGLQFVAELPFVPYLVGRINKGEWRCPPEAQEGLAKLLSDVCSVNVAVSDDEEQRKTAFSSLFRKRRAKAKT